MRPGGPFDFELLGKDPQQAKWCMELGRQLVG